MFNHLKQKPLFMNETPAPKSSFTEEQKLSILKNTLFNPTQGGKKTGQDPTEPWSAMAEFVSEGVWNELLKNPSVYKDATGEFDAAKVKKCVQTVARAFKLMVIGIIEESDQTITEINDALNTIKSRKEAVVKQS